MWKITGWYEQLSWFPMKYHPFWCLNPAYMDSNIQQTSSSNGWFTNTRPQMSQIWAMPRLHPWYPTVLISYHSLYHPWWLDSSISKTKKHSIMCHNIPWYPVLSHNIPIKMAIVPIVVVKFLEFPPSSVNSSMIDPYFIISRREKRNHWKTTLEIAKNDMTMTMFEQKNTSKPPWHRPSPPFLAS